MQIGDIYIDKLQFLFKIGEFMEKKILRDLYIIDNQLENIVIEVMDNDFTTDNKELSYMLTSIEILARKIKEKIK